jgi:hypothetical protein
VSKHDVAARYDASAEEARWNAAAARMDGDDVRAEALDEDASTFERCAELALLGADVAEDAVRDEVRIDRMRSAPALGALHVGAERIWRISELGGSPMKETGWPKLSDAARYGLAGVVVGSIEPHTEADPAALLADSLAMFGNAVGRGPHVRVGAAEHAARLNVAQVGPTARARKGTAVAEVRPIIVRADPDWETRILGGFGSGEALIEAVSEKADPENPYDHRLLVREPELARILRVAGRDGSTLSSIVREAWDGDVLQLRVRKSVLVARGAHVSVIGDVTVEELRRELTDTDAMNGFANRFLFVACKRSQRLPRGEQVPERTLNRLVKNVRERLDAARKCGTMKRTPAAEALWADIYNAIDDNVGGLFGYATARAEAQMLRLSLIYALLDGDKTIDVAHVEAALAFWNYCEETAAFVFGSRLGDPVADQLLVALRDAHPEGLDRTEQSAVFDRHQPKSRLDYARGLLLERGLAEEESFDTPGARRHVLYATPP